MGVEKHKNDKIERNYPHDTDRQKQEAFDQWLRQKPDACWRDIIDALFKLGEVNVARRVERKYDWKDPRVYVNRKHVSALSTANLRAKPIPDDLACRKFLSRLDGRQLFYTFDVTPLQRANECLALKEARHYAGLIEKRHQNCHNLSDFLESIEKSERKKDFKIGLEARFGKMYWKFDSTKVLPPTSTTRDWVYSKQLRKAVFNTEVKGDDVDRLFEGKERLGKEAFTRIAIEFTVDGRAEGNYSALVHENCGMFYLDAVYRQQDIYDRARVDINLAGRKYDLRISDCSECILLEEETSVPFGMARTIADSLCTLPDGRLELILFGSGATSKRESTFKVKYVRKRVHRQYEWKPEKKWILAQYDVNVFNDKPNKKLKADSAPLNEAVSVEYDYSRKEVELWGRRIYPKDVNKTHPSREKYYYFEGVDGVRLPGGEVRPPCNWTAKDLMSDFEEFLEDAFKIAYILDGAIL